MSRSVASDPSAEPARRAATPDETRALAHPLRLRIIRLLYDDALSNKALATRLAQHPATVLHHVRTLVRTGFIEPAGEQPGARGTVEKLYRTTHKSWNVSVEDQPDAQRVSHAVLDAFVEEVRGVDDFAASRLALTIAPERLDELKHRIGELLDEYALHNDVDGERWALFVAFHRRD